MQLYYDLFRFSEQTTHFNDFQSTYSISKELIPRLNVTYFPNGGSLKYYTIKGIRNGEAEYQGSNGCRATATYVNNLLHGQLQVFEPNYTISITFDKGIKSGSATVSRHGEYLLECTHVNDKLHGLAKKTYATGEIVFIRWNEGKCEGHFPVPSVEEIKNRIENRHQSKTQNNYFDFSVFENTSPEIVLDSIDIDSDDFYSVSQTL